MTAFLVINHFLKGEKYDILHNHLVKSAKNLGIDLKIKTNLQMLFDNEPCDFVLFWDKDVNLAKTLEGRGIKVFNCAKSIELCDSKAKTYIALDGIVNQPKTIVAPLSFFNADYGEFVDRAIDVLGLPLVFKECYGSFGEQVFLCQSKSEIMSHINGKEFLLQQFIADSVGEDMRLEIVGDKCVSAMKRKNENDFRSNITNGGTAFAVEPTPKQVDTAIKATKALGLTFAGVDILGEDIVCEVNSNAHIINIMNCTGVDIAPIIFKEIMDKL
jgi:RimK family alpha-L-glutamate ligase